MKYIWVVLMVFLQSAFRKLIQYEKENTYHSP